MAIYKPYPKYKNSNIPWLVEIPEHWEVRKVKYLFKEQDKRSLTGSEDLLSVSQYTGVTKKSDKVANGDRLTNAKTLEGYKIVSKGDLVINIMLAWNGSLGISKYDGIVSPAYCVYKLKEGNEKYFGYLFKTKNAQQEFKKNSTGIIDSRLRLYTDDFFSIKTAVPPFEEQTAIARFLDYKLAKINRFIQKKKQLIKLLNEQKAAIINQAVTKGLDPNVKMKDSGIEWLGEIPEHWEVSKIKWLTPVKRGASPRPIDDPIYFDEDGEFGWVRIADVTASERYLENTTQKLSELGSSLSVKQFPGDLFLSIAGSVGKPIITKIKCCIHDGFVWFPLLQINKEFIYYIFIAGRCYLGLGKMGTQLNLNTDSVGGITIPLPPTNEIDDIVEFLDLETATINTTISTIEKEIALVEEYKTALIAEAVTGKIDVRGYEVPEVTEEETYEEIEEEISITSEDAEAYQTVEE
ncbi:MAG: restriction endonuclease subunit S [Bacteroidetes bacterium]|nr:restriction endonuclease subunit S [Bacteroidota bacterium]